MARGRARSTGMFQQQELRAKIKRLEEEIAKTRAAADEAARRVERSRELSAAGAKTDAPEEEKPS